MIDGLVIKGVASRYKVDTADGIVTSYARGKLKIDGEIRVGDKVGVEKQGKDFVIAKVYERKNALIRPYVANVDVCFIVIAPVPAPDFMLVDKIIVNARMNGIEPVLLINKTDIVDESFVKCTESDYRDVLDVIATSAKTKLNKDKIFEKTKGKTACLAGQSAVGKSSLLNMLTGTESQETGGLSKKTERGKTHHEAVGNTCRWRRENHRHVRIFDAGTSRKFPPAGTCILLRRVCAVCRKVQIPHRLHSHKRARLRRQRRRRKRKNIEKQIRKVLRFIQRTE